MEILFGCEVDMDSEYNIGVPKERWKDFDFIIVSTTHFHHMAGEEWENADNKKLAELWVKRFRKVLESDLPFGKVGIAHLACGLINMRSREDYLEVLSNVSDEDMRVLFTDSAKLGLGIELNYGDVNCGDDEIDKVFRMFRIAKDCGCKFYLGSDAHERWAFDGVDKVFVRAIDILGLTEADKFRIKVS